MKTRITVVSCLGLALSIGAGAFAVQGTTDKPKTPPPAPPSTPAKPATPAAPAKPAAPATPPKPGDAKPADLPPGVDAAMMEAWGKFMTPGPQHELLAKQAGAWDLTVTHWMAPGTTPEVSKATSKCEMIMGGRFLLEKVNGEGMGGSGPFEGMGVTGYDNGIKKFVFSWVDNMGTGIMQGTGERSADGKKLTTVSHMTDPMTGKEMSMRAVETFIDADNKTSEFFGPGPDGKEFKTMEIAYKRRK